MTYTPQHVHLVGSIGLPSGADVFHTCGRMLGRRLQLHAAGSRELAIELRGPKRWVP